MFKLSSTSLRRLEGVDDRLLDIIDMALKISLVDFGIPADGGVRTAERQNELFKQGVSKCNGFTTPSYHQSGLAFDVYAYVGKASWNEAHLAMVATAILQAAAHKGHPLRWGGLWKRKRTILVNGIQYGWDCGHFELRE